MLHEFIISGIILLGGMGGRFNDTVPKQFHKLSGKKVYLRTLDKFCTTKLFDEVILVCHPDWVSTVEKDIEGYTSPKIRVISGGKTRQESSHRGILASHGDYVVIHDAVRPFVTERILRENVEGAIAYGAVDTCIRSADTIVHSLDGERITAIPDRDQYLRGQTPQSFSKALILKAHKQAGNNESSCECRLVREQGTPVHVVEGDEGNMKITTKLDLFIAEQMLRIQNTAVQRTDATSLIGKKFVVAGGTSGIGKALVEQLQAQGAIPIVISRSAKKYPADLSKPKEVEKVFRKIHRDHGPVDGLINCIGLLKIGLTDLFSLEELGEQIACNFTATVTSCKECTFNKGAHIVNLSSSSYFRGRSNYTLYSSMKAAIVNFTQGYAEEHPDWHVNVVVPQRTSTPMRWTNFPGEDPSTLLSPFAVADAIINLLGSTDITGTIMEVKMSNNQPKLSLGLLHCDLVGLESHLT
jgi:ribitol-5-phosphate 2-dehydrogenase (NADP+) / D-ribitol-5-phosphate cytidylyltransferase